MGANKNLDVMRVQEEQLLFICLLSYVYFGVLLLFCCGFLNLSYCVLEFSLSETLLFIGCDCDSTLGLSEFIQVLLRHVVMGPVQHVRLTSYYMQGKVV